MAVDRHFLVIHGLALLLALAGIVIPLWIVSEGNVTLLEAPALVTMLLCWSAAALFWWRGRTWLVAWEDHQRSRRAFYTIDHGGEMVYWVSEDNRILDVNERLLRTLGYDREALKKKSPALIDHLWSDENVAEWRKGLTEGSLWAQSSSYVAWDGRSIPVEQRLTVFNEQGNKILCVFALDVTGPRRMERELEQTRNLLSLFLEGLTAGAFIRDKAGTFLYCNKKFQEWLPQVKIGKTLWDIFEQAEADLYHQEDLSVLANGAHTFESVPPLSAQGPWFEFLKFPIVFPDSPPLIAGIVMDITSRRASEIQIAETNAFLEAVLKQSPIGMIVLTPQRTVRTLNSGAREILGIADFEQAWKILTSVWSEEKLYTAEAWAEKRDWCSADGSTRPVLVNVAPVLDDRGGQLAILVMLQDISELQEAQKALQLMNHHLEILVENRTKALSESNEALRHSLVELQKAQDHLIQREKLASLGSLVAGVAHEINTPVGVSVTAASFLRERTQTLMSALDSGQIRRSELDAYLDVANQSTGILLANLERASNLIKSFKMISVDQSTDPCRQFPLKAYLEEVLITLRAPQASLKVNARVEGDPSLQMKSFPGSLAQIVTNLFMNSCVHGFEGRQEGQILLSFQAEQGRVRLIYADNGKGMTQDVLEQIFEPFFTTRRDLGGSGLGMNIVFNLVHRKLGGTIEAWSHPDEGVRFTLDLPQESPLEAPLVVG